MLIPDIEKRLKPWSLAVIVGVIYIFLLIGFISRYDFNPSATIFLSEKFYIEHSDQIPSGVVVHQLGGYDGQDYYYNALEPLARIEQNPYKYQRVGFPLLVKAVALGDDRWVPIATQLVIIASIMLLTYVCASYLLSKKHSMLGAVPLAFMPAMIGGLTHALLEPTTLLLVVAATIAMSKQKHLLAGLLFTLGLFVKEAMVTVILFSLIWIAWDMRKLIPVVKTYTTYAMSGIWYLLFQAYLYVQTGVVTLFLGSANVAIPLVGIIESYQMKERLFVPLQQAAGIGDIHLWFIVMSPYLAIPLLILSGVYLYEQYRKKNVGLFWSLALIHLILYASIRTQVWAEALPNIGRSIYLLPAFIMLLPPKGSDKWYWSIAAYTIFLGFVVFVGQFIVPVNDPFFISP